LRIPWLYPDAYVSRIRSQEGVRGTKPPPHVANDVDEFSPHPPLLIRSSSIVNPREAELAMVSALFKVSVQVVMTPTSAIAQPNGPPSTHPTATAGTSTNPTAPHLDDYFEDEV
jgi:hypothetical protein